MLLKRNAVFTKHNLNKSVALWPAVSFRWQFLFNLELQMWAVLDIFWPTESFIRGQFVFNKGRLLFFFFFFFFVSSYHCLYTCLDSFLFVSASTFWPFLFVSESSILDLSMMHFSDLPQLTDNRVRRYLSVETSKGQSKGIVRVY